MTESIRPRKSLGQHFLRDSRIPAKIVSAMCPTADDVVLEIGPGEGALTGCLAETGCRLIIVDIDSRVTDAMRARFGGRLEIVQQDILTVDPSHVAADHGVERIRVVGNIPYYITSPILFHFLDRRSAVRDLVLMVQKEVGRRIVSGPGSKEYGIVSVIVQMFADVEALFDVQPGSFYPRPKVTSTVVRISMLPRPRFDITDESAFRKIVRTAFGKRRKTLRNSLRDLRGVDLNGIDAGTLSRRPEDLTVEEFARLSNVLASEPALAGQVHPQYDHKEALDA